MPEPLVEAGVAGGGTTEDADDNCWRTGVDGGPVEEDDVDPPVCCKGRDAGMPEPHGPCPGLPLLGVAAPAE